jgi:hypothetical protein
VLDLYHFALVDLVGSAGAQLTNLSAGANIKPNERLRLTASYNHVDTETLNVQANGYLSAADPNSTNFVNNELTLVRLATDEVRGSVSAGLGRLQRFEVTTAVAYRMRPDFTLYSPTGVEEANISAAKSIEVFGGIVDRHSIKDARIGASYVQTFGTGAVPYGRSKFTAVRGSVGHDIKDGQGEWEAEVSYSTSQDTQGSTCLTAPDLLKCYGFTNGTVLSVGGTVYYRFNRDWLGIVNAYITQTQLHELTAMGATTTPPPDPAILGLSGYLRIAYRF